MGNIFTKDNKIINIEIRVIAFEKVVSEVVGELIQNGDFDKVIIFWMNLLSLGSLIYYLLRYKCI